MFLPQHPQWPPGVPLMPGRYQPHLRKTPADMTSHVRSSPQHRPGRRTAFLCRFQPDFSSVLFSEIFDACVIDMWPWSDRLLFFQYFFVFFMYFVCCLLFHLLLECKFPVVTRVWPSWCCTWPAWLWRRCFCFLLSFWVLVVVRLEWVSGSLVASLRFVSSWFRFTTHCACVCPVWVHSSQEWGMHVWRALAAWVRWRSRYNCRHGNKWKSVMNVSSSYWRNPRMIRMIMRDMYDNFGHLFYYCAEKPLIHVLFSGDLNSLNSFTCKLNLAY